MKKKLSELENRKDGDVQIIDVKLNSRKTKKTNGKNKTEESQNKIPSKDIPEITTTINETIHASNQLKNQKELENRNINIQKFNKKNNDRSKMPDRRKGYIQKVSIGNH